MGNWLYRKILAPLLALLRQGVSPSRLALCVAIGIVVGNIPILGVSTILCSLIALLFRLNLPAMQIVQAAMAPSQILLIIPFVRLGEWIMRDPPQPLSIEAGMQLLAVPFTPTYAEYIFLKGRRVLADQMEYLVAHFPRSSPLHERMQRWPM